MLLLIFCRNTGILEGSKVNKQEVGKKWGM